MEMLEIKIYPVHALKAYKGSVCIVIFILNFDTRWKWVFNFTPRPLCQRGSTPVPCEISGFRRDVFKSSLFWDLTQRWLVVRTLSSLTVWPLKMETICPPETSITTNQCCVIFQNGEYVNFCTHWVGSWVGPRIVLDDLKERNISGHCPNSDPGLFSP